jgi:hypothetical protein
MGGGGVGVVGSCGLVRKGVKMKRGTEHVRICGISGWPGEWVQVHEQAIGGCEHVCAGKKRERVR